MLPYQSFLSWTIGPLTIQAFGLMMALAFIVGTWLFIKRFPDKTSQDNAMNLGVIAILGGVIGARVLYAIENPSHISGLLEFLNFWQGGLSWHGGFIGAVLGSFIYCKINGLSFLDMADKIAPSIAIGHAIGRIGCILGDGGHVGKQTSMPWGFDVYGTGVGYHVTAWYELIGLLIIFGALMWLSAEKGKQHKANHQNLLAKIINQPGSIFGLYMVLYSTLRLISDFFRTDPTYMGLTAAQYLSIAVLFAGMFILSWRMVTHKRKRI